MTATKHFSNSEKKKLVRSLTLALKAARHIQFPTNIELVQKYYDKIYMTTMANHDGYGSRNSSVVRAISD